MSFRKLLCESPSLYVPPCQNKLLEDHIISPLCIRVCVCGWSSIGKWSWPICLDTAGALLAPQIGDHQPHNCVAEPPMPHSLYIKGVLLLLRFNVIPIIQEWPCVERRTHPCNNSVPSHHGGGAWMSQRWVNMLRYQGWFGSGWIPQAKFILPIYPADLKRCLCRLTLPSWRIFVDFHRLNHISLRSVAIISQLWHLRDLWCTQLFHPDVKQTQRHCDIFSQRFSFQWIFVATGVQCQHCPVCTTCN